MQSCVNSETPLPLAQSRQTQTECETTPPQPPTYCHVNASLALFMSTGWCVKSSLLMAEPRSPTQRWALALTPESLPTKRPPSSIKKRKKKNLLPASIRTVSPSERILLCQGNEVQGRRGTAWMGEGVWQLRFVWMAGIRRGSHKFSRGLLGAGECALEDSRAFHCKVFSLFAPWRWGCDWLLPAIISQQNGTSLHNSSPI